MQLQSGCTTHLQQRFLSLKNCTFHTLQNHHTVLEKTQFTGHIFDETEMCIGSVFVRLCVLDEN